MFRVEKRFENYRKVAKEVNQNLKKFKEEDKEAKKKLKFELKKLRYSILATTVC